MQNPHSIAKRIYIINFPISKNYAKGYDITTWYVSIVFIDIYIYKYILSYVIVSYTYHIYICVYIIQLLHMYYEFFSILFLRSMTLKKTLQSRYKAYILNTKLSKLKKHTSHFCCFILFVQNLRDDQDFNI